MEEVKSQGNRKEEDCYENLSKSISPEESLSVVYIGRNIAIRRDTTKVIPVTMVDMSMMQ